MRKLSQLVTAVSMAASAVALGVPGAAPQPASAATNDIVAIVIDGTGNGHGRGMSQWGAYGYAVNQGWPWTQILDHYYGGTVLGNVGGGETRIKVRLMAYDGLGTVGLVSHGTGVTWNGQTRASMQAVETSAGTFDVYGSTSIACPSGVALSVPSGSPPIAQESGDSSGVRQIQTFLKTFHDAAIGVDGSFGPQTKAILTSWQTSRSLPADGIWSTDDAAEAQAIIDAAGGSVPWTKLGTAAGTQVFSTTTGDDSGAAVTTNALGVCSAAGAVTHYRGTVEVSSQSDGNRVVNNVLTEDYVRGVVPKEVSASWGSAGGGAGMNALRAQAVAARSYGLQQNKYSYATTCDTQSCQVYGGAATRSYATGTAFLVEDYRTNQAIAETAGKIRRWPAGNPKAGQLVSTEFSASNGPRTAGGEFPAVDDIGDATANNPNHRWTRVIDADDLEARFGLGQMTGASMVDAAASQYQGYDGIWFNDLVLTGTSKSRRTQAWDFRGIFNLPSPGFTVRVVREDTTSRSFGMIGDSVGESIASSGAGEFDRLIDGTFASATISNVSSRCTVRASCPGTSGVDEAATLPFGLDLVVVELGYNDAASTFASDIDAMMNALTARGARRVAWVNMADIRTNAQGSIYGPMNARLAAAAGNWPTLKVLDWDTASRGTEARARWFADGVHLTTTGQAEFALWLRAQVLELAPSHYLAPPKKISIPIVGKALKTPAGANITVPPTATAVAINVTSTRSSTGGYVTVWPCATERRETSNLNVRSGVDIANNVVASIDAAGEICLWSNVGTDVIVDVTGWFDSSGSTTPPESVSPERIVDSRYGIGSPRRKLGPATPLVIDVVGQTATRPDGTTATVPSGVTSVLINLTAVDAAGIGYFTVWPCAQGRKETSSLNYAASEAVANGVISAVDKNGQVCIYSLRESNVVVDLQGWFGPTNPAFAATDPHRIVDTRIGRGAPRQIVKESTPLTVPIRGITVPVDGAGTVVPANAVAAVVNVVSTQAAGPGYATVWSCEGNPPNASNLNFIPGVDVANGVIAPIGPDGSICVYSRTPSHIVVDITGWLVDGFVGATPSRFVDTRYGIGPAPR